MKFVDCISVGLLAATVLLSGCAASVKGAAVVPANRVEASEFLSPNHGPGKVTIVRASYPNPCDHQIQMDSMDMVKLRPGEKVTLYVPPGRHVFRLQFSSWCGGQPVETSVEVGKQDVVVADEMDGGYYALHVRH